MCTYSRVRRRRSSRRASSVIVGLGLRVGQRDGLYDGRRRARVCRAGRREEGRGRRREQRAQDWKFRGSIRRARKSREAPQPTSPLHLSSCFRPCSALAPSLLRPSHRPQNALRTLKPLVHVLGSSQQRCVVGRSSANAQEVFSALPTPSSPSGSSPLREFVPCDVTLMRDVARAAGEIRGKLAHFWREVPAFASAGI
jgi:hypothetical protein